MRQMSQHSQIGTLLSDVGNLSYVSQVGTDIWRMMVDGKPKQDPKTNKIIYADANQTIPEREYWAWGDMQVSVVCIH